MREFSTEVQAELEMLAQSLRQRGWLLTTAESCTGGLIAAACTSLAGSSEWFDRGFVTYSNQAKVQMLGVGEELLTRHGAVSREVACAMAAGALSRSAAHLAVAVTGIAGPGGAVPGKPVGTVWLATAVAGCAPSAVLLRCDGDRAAVRHATVLQALGRLVACAVGPGAVPPGTASNSDATGC